jgi:S1-C subfamily serine protease
MFRCILSALIACGLILLLGHAGLSANQNTYLKTLQSTAWVVTGDATGTGVLVDAEERLVFTNYHVVEGHSAAGVYFPRQRGGRAVSEREYYLQDPELRIEAKVVASDKSRDVAILKLTRIPDGIVAISFGPPCLPGQSIHSVGNPGASGALWSYAFGKVRQNYYLQSRFGFGKTQMQMLETTAMINPGDSGGPIVNDAGQLVGLSQSYHKQHRGYAYGVDISEITWFLKKYRQTASGPVSSDDRFQSPLSDIFSNPSASNPSSARRGSFKDLPMFAASCRRPQPD